MIKYFKELEDKKNYYLPLVRNEKREITIKDYRISLSFMKKYQDLFKYSELIINKFKKYTNKNNGQLYESIQEELEPIIEDFKYLNIKPEYIENYLRIVKEIIRYFKIETNNKDYEILEYKFNEALEELNNISTIICGESKVDNHKLPDAWFITSNNRLYNTGKDGHKGTNLVYAFDLVKHCIINDIKLEESNYYLEIYRNIMNNGYITETQFKLFLNLIGQPNYINRIHGNNVSYEKHIVDTVSGVVIAHRLFFKYFEDFINESNNSKRDLDTLIRLTNNYVPDILVRCCGFHKVESSVDRMITTSCINYENDFIEYLENGWDINFIPPIIIQEGELKEYPSDFLKIKMFR